MKADNKKSVEQSKLSAEERLNNFGYFLIKQGYGIDITDDFWMEDCLFSEHKVRDIYELCEVYHAQFKELPEEELRKELVKFSDAFNNTGHIYITSGFIDEQLKNR